MVFTPLGFSFGRVGVNPVGGRPDDGTAYVQAAFTQSLTFRSANGSFFDLASVDLAEYSTFFQNQQLMVHFIGYRSDGSIVTTDLITDGIIDGDGPLPDFQTFQFDDRFTGLTRVEIPTSLWSLDNLVVSVPEPSTWCLLLVSGLLLSALKFCKRGND